MKRLDVGASLEQAPTKGYTKHLSFAELAPRPPRPQPRTLGRWGRSLPDGFATALVVPPDLCAGEDGWLALGDAEDEAFAWVEAACVALKPAAVVVRTGRELTTGAQSKRRLEHYFERLVTPGARRVWAASGLWEGRAYERMADRLGVLPAVDPLAGSFRPTELLYARVQGLGERNRLGDGLLLDLIDRLDRSGCEEAMVVFESRAAVRQARRLRELATLEGLVEAAPPSET